MRAKAVNLTVSPSSTSHTIPGLRSYTTYTVAVLVLDTKGSITTMPDEKSILTPIGRELSKQMRNSMSYICMSNVKK